tara:strand:+ start:1410 stop:1982 length:573 start_codon:yes stop_codon:yes gene_type:complete
MSRGVASATATELATKSFNIVNLLEFQGIGGASERLYLTDAPVDITNGGNTYVSTRGMMGVGDITEEETIKIESIEITLSGVESANVKLFLDFDYIDRRVLVHRAVIGNNHELIGTAILVFDGRLDQPRLTEDWKGQTATLAVSATSHWADFEAQSGRHSNPTEQKILFSGDTFFDKATETQKDVKWGKT